MNGRAALALGTIGIIAGALLLARRASAASGALPELHVRPYSAPPLGPPARDLPPPPGAGAPLGELIGGAVDQVKDALKGLGLWSKKVPEQYRELFAMAGAQYRLPPGLLEAVAYRESRFRADIISGQVRSAAGAVGIMQIVPRWHPELGEAGALDPARAVPYAARYLRQLFEQFGNWQHAVAAYNWGQGNLSRALSTGSSWPAETVAYVGEVLPNAGLA